jgi:two-component system CheB/CheR fusion protein
MEGQYQISKSIRELCVFSRHNMAADPPFSRIDLVSCRNVLIYMDQALQKRVLPTLHYALNLDGYLFLGSSEHIGTFSDLFGVVDAKHRIFVKKPAATGMILDYHPQLAAEGWGRPVGRPDGASSWSALDVQKEADRILLARYAPVGVIVDEAMTVIQFRGRTAAYLEPAPGMASLDLFRMLREGLLAEVRAAVAQAKSENAVTTREGLFVRDGEESRPVRVEVVPFKLAPAGVRFLLVLFHESPPAAPPAAPAGPPARAPGSAEQQVVQVQQELAAMREYLQSVIEQQESTNEELKSANEEILSSNEELQSTNEELQTAKEEAQSANEELATVNEELRHRNAELARVNGDLVNLLSGVGIPIVMVGRDLRIRRFTPLAERLFNLIPTDVGRPISDMKANLDGIDLAGLIARVIDTLAPHESHVKDAAGHRYLLRIRPYVTIAQKIDGASIVLLDIDGLVKAANGAAS